ncbi:unnamed protein product, partial [Allacma fusca]
MSSRTNEKDISSLSVPTRFIMGLTKDEAAEIVKFREDEPGLVLCFFPLLPLLGFRKTVKSRSAQIQLLGIFPQLIGLQQDLGTNAGLGNQCWTWEPMLDLGTNAGLGNQCWTWEPMLDLGTNAGLGNQCWTWEPMLDLGTNAGLGNQCWTWGICCLLLVPTPFRPATLTPYELMRHEADAEDVALGQHVVLHQLDAGGAA